MGDLRQVLRYFIPGTITLAITLGWFSLDKPPGDRSESPDSLAEVAALSGVALTLGFFASALTSEIRHRLPWPLLSLNDDVILTGVGESVPQTREEREALLDVLLHLRARPDIAIEALQRERALVDLWNALGSAFSAVLIALLAIATVVLFRLWTSGENFSQVVRPEALWSTVLVSGVLIVVFASGQRRVARVTSAYLRSLLSRIPIEQPPP